MSKQSQLTKSALYLQQHESILICPLCEGPMEVTEFRSLKCNNRHTFDIARQGYVNLLTKPAPTQYGKDLFSARQQVINKSCFFDALTHQLTQIIKQYTTSKINISIADMGAGEGSHLHNISRNLSLQTMQHITGLGLDISKEGILEAAKSYEGFIWLVADLAQPPMRDHCIDVILNILSPSHYDSFQRLLRDDGLIIKVVPGQHYLQEIRAFFHHETEQPYSNTEVVQNFTNHFELIDQISIEEHEALDQITLKSLVRMTPLTWQASEETINEFLHQEMHQMTLNLEILVGKKKFT